MNSVIILDYNKIKDIEMDWKSVLYSKKNPNVYAINDQGKIYDDIFMMMKEDEKEHGIPLVVYHIKENTDIIGIAQVIKKEDALLFSFYPHKVFLTREKILLQKKKEMTKINKISDNNAIYNIDNIELSLPKVIFQILLYLKQL